LPEFDIGPLVIIFLVLIFSLTVHEMAHAWSASRLGDQTARRLGRVSLNPVVHIDPIGTLLLPLLAMISSAPIIGWAKPTPVNTRNLRHPRRDHILVTMAGPISNLMMAVAATIAMRALPVAAAPVGGVDLAGSMLTIAGEAVHLNVLLAVFNLLPIPPLDGGHIVAGLLPPPLAMRFRAIEQYGFLILMGLLITGALRSLIAPPYYLILSWLR
jgi:Zn-dependent protease